MFIVLRSKAQHRTVCPCLITLCLCKPRTPRTVDFVDLPLEYVGAAGKKLMKAGVGRGSYNYELWSLSSLRWGITSDTGKRICWLIVIGCFPLPPQWSSRTYRTRKAEYTTTTAPGGRARTMSSVATTLDVVQEAVVVQGSESWQADTDEERDGDDGNTHKPPPSLHQKLLRPSVRHRRYIHISPGRAFLLLAFTTTCTVLFGIRRVQTQSHLSLNVSVVTKVL